MSERETTLLSHKERLRMFGALFMNEFKKLTSRKRYTVFFLIGAALCLINLGIKMLVRLVATGGAFENIFKTDLISLGMLSFFAEVLIPFIAFLAVSDIMASEYQSGSIRAVLMRPVSRAKIYFSKVFAVFSLCIISFLGLYAVSAILDAACGNMDGADFAYSLGIYIIDLIPVFIVVLMGAFINSMCRNSGMAMFICIAVYAVLKVGGIFMPSLSGLLFTGYTKWHTLWLGTTLPFNVMLSKLMLIFGYAVVFASGGYYIFLKSDF